MKHTIQLQLEFLFRSRAIKNKLFIFILALLLSTNFAFAQVSALKLDAKLSNRGKNLNVTFTPNSSASSCTYNLFAIALKRGSEVGKEFLLGTIPGEDGTTAISVNRIKTLKGAKKNQTIRFKAEIVCENTSITSNNVDLVFKRKPNGSIKSLRKFLNKLSARFALFSLILVEAYPNLVFDRPIDYQIAKDGTNRIFIAEQSGFIKIVEDNPEVNSTTTFLDISNLITTDNFEQGLLGLVFHPNYQKNGYLFVHYTRLSDGASVIARFSVDPNDPNIALPNSELILLVVNQPFGNHNAGQIAFGPDGFLYIGMGDGGSADDPFGHGQNLKTLLGSMLRINVNKQSNGKNYSIPKGNPHFNNSLGIPEEIYAYGLRNPWRFSFDSKTKKLWLADVGQDDFEEINIIKKGKNYGWNTMEAFACFPIGTTCDQNGLELPIHAYPHEVGRSITGGYVYRGKLNFLKGYYIYADFITGRIWALRKKGKKVTNTLLFDTDSFISSFGLNKSKDLFLLSYIDGKIYKLTN